MTKRGALRSRALRIAVGLAVLGCGATAPIALAARVWSIGASPSTIPAAIPIDVDLAVANTGGGGGGDELGCILVTIPPSFTVSGASVVSASAGTWTATATPAGSDTLVTFASSGARLAGGSTGDSAVFRVSVVAAAEGTFTWATDAKNQSNCGAGDFPNVNLSITVGTPANQPPTAAGDSWSIHQGQALTLGAPGVLGNDSDADGDPLSAVVDSSPVNGSLTLDPNGSFTYTPDPGYVGQEVFTYHADDGTDVSSSATVVIDVTDAAPTAGDDAWPVEKNVQLSVGAGSGLLANDVDSDGDGLTVALGAGPAHGTLGLAADGSFTYNPDADWVGTDQFTYAVSDGALSATGTVTLTVANGAPVAVDDAYAGLVAVPLIVPAGTGLLANDTDPNGDGLTVTVDTPPGNGALLLGADGSFTYTPGLLFSGVDQFTYRISDGDLSTVGTVTIAIANAAPTAVDDSVNMAHDRTLVVPAPGPLSNDIDPNGDTLSAILVSGPANGTVNLGADGSFDFTPNAGFVGSDQFTYRASDGSAVSAVATVSIDISNAAPVALADSATVAKNGSVSVVAPGVLGNDTDADGDGLGATVTVPPTHGTLSLSTDGSWVYIPTPGFTGFDSFNYAADDGIVTDSATVTITISNTPPAVIDDAWTTFRNGSLSQAAPGVLANDTDPNGDALVVSLVSGPAHGSLTLSPNGALLYTPAAGYAGSDAITYRADDGDGGTADATVAITVVNRAPVASDDSYVIASDGTLVVPDVGVLGNDGDPDGDALVAATLTPPHGGSVTLLASGGFTYVPTPGFVGFDVFTYRAEDGLAADAATVTIEVTAPAPTPTPVPTPPATPSPTTTPTPSATAAPASTPTAPPSDSPVASEPPASPTPAPSAEPSSSPAATPSPQPAPSEPPASSEPDTFQVPGTSPGGAGPGSIAVDLGLVFAGLTGMGLLLWAVPGLALSVPGLLVILAIAGQATSGLIWLPIVRRRIGSFGLRRPRATS